MLRNFSSSCPYCGEPQRIEVDLGEGLPQDFTWDCSVCCRPMEVEVSGESIQAARLRLRAEDDL